MRKSMTGNNRYIKEMNESIILDLIRTSGGISRKSLADKTGLSPTASGAIVRKLLNNGYIWEVGEGESSGGRKPVMLELKPRSYFAFGFDIDVRYIYTTVLDLTGGVVYRHKLNNDSGLSTRQAVEMTAQEYKKALSELKLSGSRILGAGVSVPGMMELETRKIVLAPNLGWSNADLLGPLHKTLNIPIYLDNESMCSANCENWLGQCRDVEDFICINIESGIGAGIFMSGKMYRGFSGSAGEIGHIPVDENGPQCKCGNRGCLETVASINGMAARASGRIKAAGSQAPGGQRTAGQRTAGRPEAETAELLPDMTVDLAFKNLLERARKGDPESLGIFEDAAVSLGKALANLINTLNPQKIVLGKRFPEYSELMLDRIRETAGKYALPYPSAHVDIVSSEFGEDSSALGAAIIPIRKLFGR